MTQFSYRTYRVAGNAETVRARLAGYLESGGLTKADVSSGSVRFRHPSVFFSTRRPLSCISKLTADVSSDGGGVKITLGVTFAKMRFYNTVLILLVCFLIPAVLSHIFYGRVEISPLSYIGIPIGVLLHYHIRLRVFRVLKRLVTLSGD